MIHKTPSSLLESVEGILRIMPDCVDILDETRFRSDCIDDLVYTAVFGEEESIRQAAGWLIRRGGAALGILPSSLQELYEAVGRGKISGFTVPAINIRALTYETAQAILRAAMRLEVGPVIFEIARSEIDYTRQRPEEFMAAVMAGAIKSGFTGPLFIQGDHFQINARRYVHDPQKELQGLKDLIWEAIEAGFYNIDVDASTLVDLDQPTIKEQQRRNFSLTAELTTMIRDLEPAGVTISVGGEIGEVGGKNSTVAELAAFMNGYRKELAKNGEEMKGISKISVQTGTTHGGIPLPDGAVARIKIDFAALEELSKTARERYGLAGAVQHGASTLPDEDFDRFPAVGTAEIHLATGFQNLIYDSPHFPEYLRGRIYDWLRASCLAEKKEDDSEEQFFYKTRKKGFGPFKAELWNLPPASRQAIGMELERQFAFLFGKLRVAGTQDIVHRCIHPLDVPLTAPAILTPDKVRR